MKRRDVFKTAGAAVIAAWALLTVEGRANAAPPSAALYARCAKACQDCMQACSACNKHCAAMVKSGMKEHERSVRLSADCRDICAVAAKLCERKGPMTPAICEACMQACKACGAECGKHLSMAPMAACAKSCTACEQACAEMIAAAK